MLECHTADLVMSWRESRRKLSSICPYCGNSNSILTGKSIPGHCCKCGMWLGDLQSYRDPSGYHDISAEVLRWQKWIMENTFDVLNADNIKTSAPKQPIPIAVCKLIQQFSDGNLSLFGRTFGISKSNLSGWVNGHFHPNFNQILKMCYSADLPLKDFLFKDNFKILISNQMWIPVKKAVRISKPINREKIKNELMRVISDRNVPPPTLKDVAKNIGCSYDHLFEIFPDLCKLTEEHKWVQKESRNYRMEWGRLLIEEAILCLYNTGVYPSYRKVRTFLPPKDAGLNIREYVRAWGKGMDKLGLSWRSVQ